MKKLILLLILCLVSINKVFAGEYDDSFYSGNWIPNVYINKVKSGVIHYRQARFIRRSSDGGIAYCIEPFEDMKYNSKYASYTSDYAAKLGISSSVWKKISLIAYYGYGYSNHKEDKWYAITQVMIWRAVDSNAQFYFTDQLNGQKITSYDDEIQEINNLVNKHSTLPSFANQTYNYSIDSNYILTDNNKVLSNYTVTTTNSQIKINQDANQLKIETTGEVNTSILFEREFTNYNRKSVVFVDSNYQNLLTPGNVEVQNFKIELDVSGGMIKIEKVDADTKSKEPLGEGVLIGSQYGIYDENENLVDTLVIDEEYQATSKLLAYGKYKIKEIESRPGYLLDEKTYEVVVDHNHNMQYLVLENQVIKTQLEIYKYYDQQLEPGVTFEIYNSSGVLIKEVTTDEEGKIVTDLYYGTYLFHQKNSIKNYLCVEDFTIVVDENTPAIYRLELHDEKFSATLRILKKDSETGQIIEEEAVFKIYDLQSQKYIEKDGSSEFKTQKGILEVETLYAGEYELEEVRAPKGYQRKSTKIPFRIDDENILTYDEEGVAIEEIVVFNDKELIEVHVPNTAKDYQAPNVFIIEEIKKKLMKKLFH